MRSDGHNKYIVVVAVVMIFFAALLMWAAAAKAQTACAPRKDIVAALKSRFNETALGKGLTAQKNLFEVFHSDQGTWTVLISSPRGVSCIIATGTDWDRTRDGGI
jgi:hypothetical protein